jgi:predicted AlkP superfamily phosphohydrolase/phosphomutase/Flp pilus assembly protein TadD
MSSRKVLLVGWDAADWKVMRPLIDAGRMPSVRRLMENGAAGQIATLHPALSPMLWTSIATGKRPFKHGIHGFTEPTPDGRGVQPVTNLSRTSKALWNILNQNGLESFVIGWWPSHPAEPIRGLMLSDQYSRAVGPLEQEWPLAREAVYPPELATRLAGLRVHPESLSPEVVERFIPRAREIDQEKDSRLGMCMRTMAECMSIHSAALWAMKNRTWDFCAVYFDSIDHFCHLFMRYHPPRQAWIGRRDFELYQNVVAMAYQFHDEMLGALIASAGADTTVALVSDHGFHPDHLRPSAIPRIPAGPAIEHRDLGVFVIGGPDIHKGEVIRGASVLDIAPTLLALFGLPAGEDMDGKLLSQAFERTPEIPPIPSWEEVAGDDGRHPSYMRPDSAAAPEMLQQMIALGYIERPDEKRALAVEKTIRELRYNLGQAYQDANRHLEAYGIFSALCAAAPDEWRFAAPLFFSCEALGLRDEMRSIVEKLDDCALAGYLKARLLARERRYAEALARLEGLSQPGFAVEMAELHLRLRQWDESRCICEKALELDPDQPMAHAGLSRIALHERRFGDAAQAALNAIEVRYEYPLAHFLLGRALAGMNHFARAAEAFRAALVLNPNFPQAHVRLASILERAGDFESAAEHRRLARRMRSGATAAAHDDDLVVVTGLPRSGTSMVMQMLAAGGFNVLSDGLRQPDEDNPRGYFEFEPVKNLFRDSKWLAEARGKAVKIVLPLLEALPPALPCRVILIERNLDEVLDSQERMLARRSHAGAIDEERRRILKEEYLRASGKVKVMLALRPHTEVLFLEHRNALTDPASAAERVNRFLGGGLDTKKMALAIDRRLYRRRAGQPAAEESVTSPTVV